MTQHFRTAPDAMTGGLVPAWEVVRTVELSPMIFPSGDSLHFRIEIQRRLPSGGYRARVWRTELFQMRPTFPDSTRASTDAVLVADDSYIGDIQGADADEVLERVVAALSEQFAT